MDWGYGVDRVESVLYLYLCLVLLFFLARWVTQLHVRGKFACLWVLMLSPRSRGVHIPVS